MRNTFKRIIKAAELQGWNVNYNLKERTVGFEISNYSPAGQDFSFYCVANTPDEMIERIIENYNCFDADEHVEMFIDAKRNGLAGVPRIRELVVDADKIDDMLRELAEAVAGD